MCDACEEDDGDIAKARIPDELVARAREIEVAMPGEPAPDHAWQVFLGTAGGSIAWPHYHRMLNACQAAGAPF